MTSVIDGRSRVTFQALNQNFDSTGYGLAGATTGRLIMGALSKAG